jgi:hypothetical protein
MMTPRSSPRGSVLAIRSADRQHVERADQVDLDDLLELAQRECPVLAECLDGVADACAVDVDPDRSEGLRDVERLADRLLIGDVGRDEPRAIAEFGYRLLAFQVDDHHAGSCVEQSPSGGESQPGGAAGDDRYRVSDLH